MMNKNKTMDIAFINIENTYLLLSWCHLNAFLDIIRLVQLRRHRTSHVANSGKHCRNVIVYHCAKIKIVYIK